MLRTVGTLVLAVVLGGGAAAASPGLEEEVAALEYHASRLEEGWQAPNRVQGLRIFFEEPGIRVAPREDRAGATDWEWGLALARWGRPGATVPAERARARADGPRVEYPRAALTEWYVNAPRGLEQGFTLPAPPSGDRGRVQLDLALSGMLVPAVAADGQSIDFSLPGGERVLHYAELLVLDARGAPLPAHMEAAWAMDTGRTIRLVFDDADAVYPVVVDPLATSPAWIAESEQVVASLGAAVATAGDVNGDGYSDLIVGAPGFDNGQADEGRAFLYLGSPSGPALTPAWIGESDQDQARYGSAIGTAGDVNGDGYSDVIVGAPGYDNFQPDDGRAWVYLGSASGLSTIPAWTARGGLAGAAFGSAVATAGDVNGDGFSDFVVGAPRSTSSFAEEGAVGVYLGSSGSLSTVAAWSKLGGQASAIYGTSVGTAGDVNGDGYADLIVGAPGFDNGQSNEGRTYVYHGAAGGLGAAPAWTAEIDQASAGFGGSVSTAGDVNGDGYADVLVGAAFALVSGRNGGNAYVYHGSALGLSQSVAFTAAGGPQQGSEYGESVGTAGDVNGDGFADVVIGCPNCINSGQMGQVFGRADVYFGSASGVSPFNSWSVSSTQSGTRYGESVAGAGDVNGDGHADVVVGAPTWTNGQTGEGRAFVYLGSAGGPGANHGWAVESEQTNAQMGFMQASAGDVNGDGYADVIVGVARFDNGQNNEGKVFLYLGAAAGLSPTAAWTVESDQADSLFGFAVAGAGDVNGDGYADVVVGAPTYTGDTTQEGRAFLYLGSPSGLAPIAAWTADGDQFNVQFGSSVSGGGDLNGDGYADILVGTPVYGGVGRVVAYLGSPSGLPATPAWSVLGPQPNEAFGAAIASVGDVNGDGYSDVVVGAFNGSNGQVNEGRAFLYLGSAAGPLASPAWMGESNQTSALFGWSVAGAGDVDGDGYSDVVVGAYLYDNGQADEGRASLYRGSPAGLGAVPAWTAEINVAGAFVGYAVAGAGDVNGDGYADVIVGGSGSFGRALVYLGSAVGLSPTAAWTQNGLSLENFGSSVASAGDVDADGYADIVVGGPGYANGQSGEGRVVLHYGNGSFQGGHGRSVQPSQRRLQAGTPVGRYLASDAMDGFRLSLLARSPFGRASVTPEWEVKPRGTAFDGAGTLLDAEVDTGTAGAAVDRAVTGLVAATAYHWRVRLRHDPVTTPFLPHGPWITVPWGGWNEAMLRTASPPPLPTGGGVSGLRLGKANFQLQIMLFWDPSCASGDTDYAVYEGTLGAFGSHAPRDCSTGGSSLVLYNMPAGNRYFLVVPRTGTAEGSYGKNGAGVERPPAAAACVAQQLGACP